MNASLVYLLIRQILQMVTQLARDDGAGFQNPVTAADVGKYGAQVRRQASS
ncbi:hypothetical protein ACNTMW_13905 [Planosporangium sp. 12N6]|uniref:hypothetical protein n=1 Tax=Planosporangium spinosum TaxID=3402278 RepID=UPI003CEB292C